MMSWLFEVMRLRQYYVMFSKSELHVTFIDSENIAQSRPLKFQQEGSHTGEDLLEKVERGVWHMEDYCLYNKKRIFDFIEES